MFKRNNAIRYQIVDVFSVIPFSGNPAGIIVNAASLDDKTMQQIAKEMKVIYGAWVALLAGVARMAEDRGLSLGGFTAEEIAALVSASFVGAESLILLGLEGEEVPLRAALRRVGDLIRVAEEGKSQ